MDRPVLTFIVPVFNLQDYVEACLVSLQEVATRVPIEVVIIDDSSTDQSKNVVRRNLSLSSGSTIRLIENMENLGPPATFNRGLYASRTPWVTFLDGDDFVHPDGIVKQLAFALEQPSEVVVVYGDVEIVDVHGRRTGEMRLDSERADGGPFTGHVLKEAIGRVSFLATVGTLVRREVLMGVNGFDERLSFCDWPMWLSLARVGRFEYSNIVVGSYRRHSASMSAAPRPQAIVDRLQVLSELRSDDGLSAGARHEARQRIRREARGAVSLGAPISDQLWRVGWSLRDPITMGWACLGALPFSVVARVRALIR